MTSRTKRKEGTTVRGRLRLPVLPLDPPPRAQAVQHFRRPRERPFTARQREHTTILVGGLSPRHDILVEGAIRSMGYLCRALPSPDLESYTRGKEYGDNGLCNPSYFTIGNLVKYLQGLEDEGMSREEIVDSHVFLTAGSCGTCRFGMYEAQYRLALRNAGFDGFRVLLLGTDDGIDQSVDGEAGLDLNIDFLLGLIQAFDVGDILNQYMYRLRAYEVEPGSVEAVTRRVLDDFYGRFLSRERYELEDHWTRLFLGTRMETPVRYVTKIRQLFASDEMVEGMREAQRAYDEVELDPFRVKPIVRLAGEFWAQTTEGDGNFNIHRFLEEEGAEVFVDRSLFTRLGYTLFIHKGWARDKRGLREGKSWFGHYRDYYRKMGVISLAERLLEKENARLLEALGGTLHEMVPHPELEALARPYWDWRTTSGESHLEIAENIYYHTHHLCHMVLAVKPFSCMPSTQSDGVQARVVEDYPGMIFLPMETSGDGEVIAHSRVQMALGAARDRAQKEMREVLGQIRWTLDDMKTYAVEHPELTRASYPVPHAPGVVGRAANLALHISSLLDDRPPRVPTGLEA